MKVLFISTPEVDFLQDCGLYGLKKNMGADLVDFPKKDIMYKSCSIPASKMYGLGFTLYKLLDDEECDRTEIDRKIRDRYFDLIVFGSIRRQKKIFNDFLKKGYFNPWNKFIFLDGEDNRKLNWLALLLGPYYKREQKYYTPFFVRRANFSIPAQKIRKEALPKEFLFAKHVFCDEAYKIEFVKNNCQKNYAFSNEANYFENIARSRYGITMKKGGWDCLRHYEIAANGTVMAFYNLHLKPKNAAPHGLADMLNVVAFTSAEELMKKIEYIDKNNLYGKLLENSLKWVEQNSCENIGKKLLSHIRAG